MYINTDICIHPICKIIILYFFPWSNLRQRSLTCVRRRRELWVVWFPRMPHLHVVCGSCCNFFWNFSLYKFQKGSMTFKAIRRIRVNRRWPATPSIVSLYWARIPPSVLENIERRRQLQSASLETVVSKVACCKTPDTTWNKQDL